MSNKKRKKPSTDFSDQLSNASKERIAQLFEGKFVYESLSEDEKDFHLPTYSSISDIKDWEVEDFMKMKSEMNTLKSSLNDKDLVKWHIHTKQIHPARKIMNSVRSNYRAEFCTQAWCKFYEIASTYLDIDSNMPYFSVHLCEAPGAFITSLNHCLFTKEYKGEWRWLATTLNPYYEGNNVGEMIEDDRFIQHTYEKWYLGVDGTGNLMSRQNMEGLRDMLSDIYVNLVTADGSIDCQKEPAEQESIVSQLHHCEALTALQILSPGGTFVLKMFTMYESASICLMYLLNRLFTEVNVFKPCCSKGANSEVYVICKNYKGRQFYESYLDSLIPLYFDNNQPPCCLFERSTIPDSFIEQHRKCVTLFRDSQRSSILRNLDLYQHLDDEERSRLNAEQDECERCFFEKYKVEPLMRQKRISKQSNRRESRIPRSKKDTQSFESNYGKRVKLDGRLTGSLSERKQNDVLPWKQKVMIFETYEKELEVENDFSCWIKNSRHQLKVSDISVLEPVTGQIISSIQSSRFCTGLLIAQAREIIQNVQWLSTKLALGQDAVSETVKHLRESILHQLKDANSGYDTMEMSDFVNNDVPYQDNYNIDHCGKIDTDLNHEKSPCDKIDSNECHNTFEISNETVGNIDESDLLQGKDKCAKDEKSVDEDHSTCQNETIIYNKGELQICSAENSYNVDIKQVDVNGHITILNGNNCDSQILKELNSEDLTIDTTQTIHFYSSVSDNIQPRYELVDQQKLLQSVTHILQTIKQGDLVIIEMGTCMSRFTAGLVYILYRSFEKIGFLHHHGNYLHCHLVCMSYQGCPIELQDYLHSISDLISTNQSEAVLEIIPIMTLIGDEEFVTFLNSTNTHLLQSFITAVIYKERDIQTQNSSS